MKRNIGVAALLAFLVIGAGATAAFSDCGVAPGMIIKFDADAFAYETNYDPATFTSASGSQLTVVGIVSQFGGVFSSINATDPTTEYTFILSGLVSNGTTGTTVKR